MQTIISLPDTFRSTKNLINFQKQGLAVVYTSRQSVLNVTFGEENAVPLNYYSLIFWLSDYTYRRPVPLGHKFAKERELAVISIVRIPVPFFRSLWLGNIPGNASYNDGNVILKCEGCGCHWLGQRYKFWLLLFPQ